jgi:TolA-binding protein
MNILRTLFAIALFINMTQSVYAKGTPKNTVSIDTLKNANASKLESRIADLEKAVATSTKELGSIKDSMDFFKTNHIDSVQKSILNSLGWLDIIICFILSLICCLFFYYKLKNRADRQRADIEKLKVNSASETMSQSSNKVTLTGNDKQMIYNLEKRIVDLSEKVAQLEHSTFSKKTKDSIMHKQEEVSNVVPLYEAPNEFYMGVPLDNSFLINSKSDKYKEGNTMYKFNIGRVQNEAEFEFISDGETIKFIQNNSLEVVRPACKFENEPSNNTSRVITTEKGKARFQDDKWIIIDKAKIRFV